MYFSIDFCDERGSEDKINTAMGISYKGFNTAGKIKITCWHTVMHEGANLH